jgi:hypothetical protein
VAVATVRTACRRSGAILLSHNRLYFVYSDSLFWAIMKKSVFLLGNTASKDKAIKKEHFSIVS